MTRQPEQILEDELVKQLQGLEYKYVAINDEKDLLTNLKTQLEKHNNISLTNGEFKKVINHLNKGNVFEKAKRLRDKMQLTKEDGTSVYIEFFNQNFWCQNQYQVTNQVTQTGKYKNRYDVTLLVNGLPLVQIELKRKGLELKEAFNQINRYQRHSFSSSQGLFQYVQVFVISNGVNTKYYANNKNQSFKQTFFWADKENKRITQLSQFAEVFLEPCHISKMIAKYIVLNDTDKILMVLRPYQYYAVEAIIDKVKNSNQNGYIWHTTGSGKTLTSFKASQVLMQMPEVQKVVFVVDRKDLDYQTIREFNSFQEGSIDGTDNTNILVNQFTDNYKDKKGKPKDTKLIVTTIQKLNTAIHKQQHLKKMDALRDKPIVFIFDECHRSQFGDTHKRIKAFFQNSQMFGFTGTPIFADNAIRNEHGKRTTKELFDKMLHQYVITDAIKDENVLRFSIEYVGRYREKEGSRNEVDIEVEAIDTKELMESPERLEKITQYILTNHNRKTHSRLFNAIFCVSSIDTLIKYYEIFRRLKSEGNHDLKIATIFSYSTNEDDKDATGFIPEADFDISQVNKHTREKLDEYIEDYNSEFNTKFSTKDSQSFYSYYQDVAKKVRNREVDILLVVNMYLTGFDSKALNTLYVDKNLRYHGLIQAYSRTNRILNEKKSQGNIVAFRNLKKATDEAIALFSDKNAKEEILLQPYEDYVGKFAEALKKLKEIAPTYDSVNELPSEDEEMEFVTAFRQVIRVVNVLKSFADFDFEDLEMQEQEFENYKSKYLDLHDKVKTASQKEKVSILEDVDFELELIHRDNVNVAYILKLLAKLKGAKKSEQQRLRKQIEDILGGEAQLRSKKELIEQFINENLPKVDDTENIEEAFETFWNTERVKAFDLLCKEEKLNPEKFQGVVDTYLFTERLPLRDDIFATMEYQPSVLERKTIAERISDRLATFVKIFVEGVNT